MADNVYYSPFAVTEDGERLFTYDSLFTLKKAMEQFSIWEDHYCYKIRDAWIETNDGRRFVMKKKWYIEDIQTPGDVPEDAVYMVRMFGRGTDGKEFLTDYEEAVKIASAKKEDWECVYIYEKTDDGWEKCFKA